MSLKTKADFTTALISAFDSLNKGIKDKADISEIEIMSAKIRSSSKTKKAVFTQALCDYLSKVNLLAPHTWYGLDFLVRSTDIKNTELSKTVRKLLEDDDQFTSKKNRYYAWNIFRISQKGLYPTDIEIAKKHLKDEAPRLWLDLVISAHRNDAPEALTKNIIELVEGRKPILQWSQLRSLFTEIRLAYDNQDTFKLEIQNIAKAIHSEGDRIQLLKAVDTRIGTSFATSRKFLNSITTDFSTVKTIARRLVQVEKTWSNFEMNDLESAA